MQAGNKELRGDLKKKKKEKRKEQMEVGRRVSEGYRSSLKSR